MKRIRIVITGGTIGSKKDESGVIRVEKDLDYTEYFPGDSSDPVEITVTSPCFVLSENMNFSVWEVIMDSVDRILAEEETRFRQKTSTDSESPEFAGLLLLHGSDTLSYTTALFGHLYERRLSAMGAKMVLTGANKPLSDPSSNGRDNLKLAWNYLLSDEEQGNYMRVCAAYDGELFDADRIMEADSYTDRFREKPLVIPPKDWSAERERMLSEEQDAGVLEIRRFLQRVQCLRTCPGFDYSLLDLDSPARPKAFVHVLYHSGTGPAELTAFLRKCKERQIQSFCVSVKRQVLSERYETTDGMMGDAVFLTDMTPEWAFATVLCRLNAPGGEKKTV